LTDHTNREGMRVVHVSDGDRRTLATNAEVATSLLEQTKGLMFRDSLPEGYGLIFRFHPPVWPLSLVTGAVGFRSIHMLFVKIPLDVLWLQGEDVVEVETLSPWTGLGIARADTVVELPAGAADGVEPGDRVVVE